MYKNYFKRLSDVLLSLSAIIILSPLLLIVSLLVKINLGSPVIFKTRRIGKNNEEFTLYKFRSMKDTVDEMGELLPNEERLTSFGIKLRATSLDELPELWNILKGDMSLIGPRPLPTLYLPYFNEYEQQRHNIKPGLTGPAQINGRNGLTWEEKFAYDVEYANNITFCNDVRIMIKTVFVVLQKEDIGVPGIDSPEDFHTHRIKQLKAKET